MEAWAHMAAIWDGLNPTREHPAEAVYPDDQCVSYCLRLESLGYVYDCKPTADGEWLVRYWR